MCHSPSLSPLLLSYGEAWLPPHPVSAADVSNVSDDIDLRGPLFELTLPGGHGGEGHNEEEGAVELMLMTQVVQERDGLDRLTQTHLIRKDHRVAPGGKSHACKLIPTLTPPSVYTVCVCLCVCNECVTPRATEGYIP